MIKASKEDFFAVLVFHRISSWVLLKNGRAITPKVDVFDLRPHYLPVILAYTIPTFLLSWPYFIYQGLVVEISKKISNKHIKNQYKPHDWLMEEGFWG